MIKKHLLLAAIVVGAGTAAFAANPTSISYGADTNYVGPAGTSIGAYFNLAAINAVTGGCEVDSSGYEKEPARNLSTSLNISGLVIDTSAADSQNTTHAACNITGTPTQTTNGTQTYGIENIATPGTTVNYVANVQITITPTSLVYPQNPLNLTVGVPVAADVPTIDKDSIHTALTYSIFPTTLPAGLSFSTTTGAITGTPTAVATATNYTITASITGADTHTYGTTTTVSIMVQAAANYATYAHSQSIKLNTTGFTLSKAVTNYPLLVELSNASSPSTDNFDFSQASATGADIRFTATRNGILINLPYQIEQWTSSGKTGSGVVWVSVDSMYANDSAHSITMYWGNGSATSASSGPAVFSPANGYVAAWHMNGGSTGTTAAVGAVEPDVTGNNFHAQDSAGGVTAAPGFIGLGRGTFGTSDFLRADGTAATPAGYGASVPAGANSLLDFPMFGNYTISAWANPGSSASGSNQYALVSKGNQDYQLQTDGSQWENTQEIYLNGLTSGAYNEYFNNQSVAAVATGWHYVVGQSVNSAAKAGSQNIYVDGAAVSHATKIYSGGHAARINNLYVTIGNYPQGTGPNDVTNWFNSSTGALLDEISISNQVRSADWVTLNFQTQCSSNSAYAALGGVGCTTVAPVSLPKLSLVPGIPTAVTATGGTAGQITVAWAAPLPNGTSAITGYKVTMVQDTSKHCTSTASTLTCNVTGLASNVTPYSFTVVAINSVGASTPSAASATATNILGNASKGNGFGVQLAGSSMMFRLPAVSGDIRVSIVDLWGRTVWNRTVAGTIGQLSWDGKSNTGASTPAGVYVVRASFQKGEGNPAKSLQATFVKP